MGDLFPSMDGTYATAVGEWSQAITGLNEYASDDELAAVELFQDYPDILLRFAAISCIIFMIIGIPGNLITIVALARCKKVRNATAIFIMNLSFSDLLFCCFNLPLAASTFWHRSWIHGRVICRMFPLLRYALVAVSLFTILAITINRYIMISHPRIYPKMYRKKYLALMVTSTWVFAFGALIATWNEQWGRFGLDTYVGSCTILPDINNRSPKEFLFVGAFMLPCLAIVVCYARIFFIVREAAKRSRGNIHRSQLNIEDSAIVSVSTAFERSPVADTSSSRKNFLAPPPTIIHPERSSSSGVGTLDGHDEEIAIDSKKSATTSETAKRLRQATQAFRRSPAPIRPPRLTPKDKKLLKMIMAIMISFWVCYLPITLTKIFREFNTYPIANIAGYLLIYLTTCINPIIYVVMSGEYRQAYKNLLTCSPRT